MSVSILNTDSGLSGKTLLNAEDAQNVTGSKSFNRAPNAPFVVQAGSAVVVNLDSDKLDGVEGSGYAALADNETISGTWSFSELITGAKGIVFPATQVASSGVNTLDDYEEGSWTPVLGGSGGTAGQTYSSQVGRYIKVGKLVTAFFTFVLTAKGTITTAVQIQGLPFTTAASAGQIGMVHIGYFQNTVSSYVGLMGVIPISGTAASLYGLTAAATNPTALATADVSNTTSMTGTIIYEASA